MIQLNHKTRTKYLLIFFLNLVSLGLYAQTTECIKNGEPTIIDCMCCPGYTAQLPGPSCLPAGVETPGRAFFGGRDTTICGPSTFNLFSLLTLYTSAEGDAAYGSLKYGILIDNYPDTITSDVTVSDMTTFILQNMTVEGCTDTAQITVFVDNMPDAGMDNDSTVCDGDVIDLTGLVSEPGGVFDDKDGSGGLSGSDFNSMNLSPGSYDIDYIVVSNNSCPNDTATLSITVINDLSCVDVDMDGVTADIDCDDNDINNYQGNTEVCDGADNDCDGVPDNGLIFNDYYADGDADGYGDPNEVLSTCDGPPIGFVANNLDNCPAVFGIVGDICDDGNNMTTGDFINDNCECDFLRIIPSISDWGLIVLSFLVFIFGLVVIRNKRFFPGKL